MRKVFNNSDIYFNLLRQFFKDLNEVKTAELRLLKFRQKGLISEYLIKFT
jgi:hypothetical protein